LATLAALIGVGSGQNISGKEMEGLQIVQGFLEGSELLREKVKLDGDACDIKTNTKIAFDIESAK